MLTQHCSLPHITVEIPSFGVIGCTCVRPSSVKWIWIIPIAAKMYFIHFITLILLVHGLFLWSGCNCWNGWMVPDLLPLDFWVTLTVIPTSVLLLSLFHFAFSLHTDHNRVRLTKDLSKQATLATEWISNSDNKVPCRNSRPCVFCRLFPIRLMRG